MSKLSNYQKKWPDTVSLSLKTVKQLSLEDVEYYATKIRGPKRTILEAKINRNSATIYVSKVAHEAGEKDGSIVFK